MGFIDGIQKILGGTGEKRSIENPSVPLTPENIFSGDSQDRVVATVTDALSIPAVQRSISVIADAICQVPIEVVEHKDTDAFDETVSYPELEYMLNVEPNAELYGKDAFFTAIDTNLLIHGNAYARIIQRKGQHDQLLMYKPEEVQVIEKNGRIYYRIEDSGRVRFTSDEILHFKLGSVDGIMGVSPLSINNDLFNLAKGILEYSSNYFKNGAFLSGVLEAPETLSDPAVKRLRRGLDKYRGARNANKVLVLEEGTRYQAISDDPTKSKMVESMAMVNNEIARVFGVPPFLLGDLSKSTMQNVEQLNLSFIQNTVKGISDKIAEELTRKLLTEEEKRSGLRIRLNTTSLLRTDSKTRAAFIKTGLTTGFMTHNEARKSEGLPPIEYGDVPLVPLNYTTIDKINDPNIDNNAIIGGNNDTSGEIVHDEPESKENEDDE